MSSVSHPEVTLDEPQIAASRAAIAFALLNVPLGVLAVAADWRTPLDAPADGGSAAESFFSYGTALSGPVPPVLGTGLLGWWPAVATAGV